MPSMKDSRSHLISSNSLGISAALTYKERKFGFIIRGDNLQFDLGVFAPHYYTVAHLTHLDVCNQKITQNFQSFFKQLKASACQSTDIHIRNISKECILYVISL